MSNTNDVKAFVAGSLQNTLAPLALGASTTETGFSVNGNSVASIAAKAAVLPISNPGLSPSFWDSGRPFLIRGWGTATTGVSTNITLKLYQVPSAIVAAGTALTLANDNGIGASTARAVNSTTAPFYFEAKLQWDSVGKALKGQISFEINNLVDVFAATTAITGLTADSELNFLVSATSSAGNAANVINLQELTIEPL